MFSSSNCGNEPISYSDHLAPNHPLFSEINGSGYFNSPFLQYFEDFESVFPQLSNDLLLYHQQMYENTTVADTAYNALQENTTCKEDFIQDSNKKSSCIPMEKQILRKKSAKGDRHSKINTAQGPRDRRMRMSLEVAQKFFALQDMLGFDKASKTVEWLLIKAKDEIIKLAKGFPHTNNQSCSNGAKSASSTSEGEVVSGIDEANQQKESDNVTKEKSPTRLNKAKKRVKRPRNAALHLQPAGKESREKARARARERTKMKNRTLVNELKISDEVSNGKWNQLCSMRDPCKESRPQSHSINPSLEEVLAEVEEPSSGKQDHVGSIAENMTDDSIVIRGNWSPSLVFNYLQNT